MSEVQPCKRGNIAERDKWGQCLCPACVTFRRSNMQMHNARNKEKHTQWQRDNRDRTRKYWDAWAAKNVERVREIRRRSHEKCKAKYAVNTSAKVRARKLAKIQRTPTWADLPKMSEIYRNCVEMTKRTGVKHEVDHIVPLRGKTVSGLHVPHNLQIITQVQNRAKGNDLLCAMHIENELPKAA